MFGDIIVTRAFQEKYPKSECSPETKATHKSLFMTFVNIRLISELFSKVKKLRVGTLSIQWIKERTEHL